MHPHHLGRLHAVFGKNGQIVGLCPLLRYVKWNAQKNRFYIQPEYNDDVAKRWISIIHNLYISLCFRSLWMSLRVFQTDVKNCSSWVYRLCFQINIDYDINNNFLVVYPVISIGNNRLLCAWEQMVSRRFVIKQCKCWVWNFSGWLTSHHFLRRLLGETIPIEFICNQIVFNYVWNLRFERIGDHLGDTMKVCEHKSLPDAKSCWPPRGQQVSQQGWIWGIHCTQATKHSSELSSLTLTPPDLDFWWRLPWYQFPHRKDLLDILMVFQRCKVFLSLQNYKHLSLVEINLTSGLPSSTPEVSCPRVFRGCLDSTGFFSCVMLWRNVCCER